LNHSGYNPAGTGLDNTGIELSKKLEKPTELQVELSGCALHGRWKLPL
jgi:hypothetical protein